MIDFIYEYGTPILAFLVVILVLILSVHNSLLGSKNCERLRGHFELRSMAGMNRPACVLPDGSVNTLGYMAYHYP